MSQVSEPVASLEESLQASEERFRAVFEQSVIGMVLTDFQGRVCRANEAFFQIVGRGEEEVVGRTSEEYTHPEDTGKNAEVVRGVMEGSGGSTTFYKRYLRRDGEVVWARVNISPVRDAQGQPVRLMATVEDVTEQKRAQLALDEREQDLRLLLGSITDYAIITISPDGVITGWNTGAELIFGYAAEEIVGQKSTALWTEADREAGEPERHRAEAERLGREHSERWHVRRDGRRFLASVVTRPMYDSRRQLKGFAKVCRDVTEQRAAEAEIETVRQQAAETLETERARLFEVFQHSPSFLAVLHGPEHIFTLVNERYSQLVGRRAVVGKKLAEALPEIAGQGFMEILDRVYATGEPFEGRELPVQLLRAAGAPAETRYVDLVYQPMRDPAGKVAGILAHGVDVTARRQSQTAQVEQARVYDLLLSSIRDHVYVFDREWRFIYANRMLLSLWGLTEEEALGRTMTELQYPAEVRQRLEMDLQAVVATGQPVQGEVTYTSPAGETGHYEYILAPVLGPGGELEKIAGTSRDVSERRREEREREELLRSERAARSEAERASRMKDEFLATLSHELRTPMNAILGWAGILRDEPTAEDITQAADVIERNARAQTQIIEDLLDMSRIISGKVRLDVQRVDLAPVIEAAIDTVRPAALAKGVRIESVLDPRANPVSGDPNRLQQVFWNLLSNAVKFTPKGGKVQVVLERVNSHLEASIVDTGQGIAPEFLPHVFERFRQADASTTRRYGGLGLGLAIVKQLVELHGGSVRAKSGGVGFGSTFSVAVPLTVLHGGPAPEEDRRHPRAERGAPPELGASVTLKGVRVLVVDDEPDARALVARLLGGYEAEVRMAASAAEALAEIGKEVPDVLVSDIGMPGEDGYSLIRRVRALGAESGGRVPALALTAYARSEDRMRAVLAGFQMHVPKPVEGAELVTMVASLAGRQT